MTVKALATLKTDIATAIADGGANTAAEVRTAFTDTIDSLNAVAGSTSIDTAYSKKTISGPVTLTPATPSFGKWITIAGATFDDTVVLASKSYVRFDNCIFQGAFSASACSHIQFINCHADTQTGASPALLIDTCSHVDISTLTLGGSDRDSLRIVDSSDVTLDHVTSAGGCTSCPTITRATGRIVQYGTSGSSTYKNIDTVFGAIVVRGCTGVAISHVTIDGSGRSGLVIEDSDSVVVTHGRITSCGAEDATNTYAAGFYAQDAGTFILNSSHVTLSNVKHDRNRVFGISLWEDIYAYGSRPGSLLSHVTVRDCLVQSQTDNTHGTSTTARSGVQVAGGKHITFDGCHLRWNGASGLLTHVYGTDYLRVINTVSEENGRNDNDVHIDGIQIETGRAPLLLGNVCERNPRNGFQFKSLLGEFSEIAIEDAVAIANVCHGNGTAFTGSALYTASGNVTTVGSGVVVNQTTSATEGPLRVQLIAPITSANSIAGVSVAQTSDDVQIAFPLCSNATELSGQLLLYGNRTTVIGGIMHGDQTLTNGQIVVGKSGTEPTDVRVIGTTMIGVDPAQQERVAWDASPHSPTSLNLATLTGVNAYSGVFLNTNQSVYVADCMAYYQRDAGVKMGATSASLKQASPLSLFISGITGAGVVSAGNGWSPAYRLHTVASVNTVDDVADAGDWIVNVAGGASTTSFWQSEVSGAYVPGV